MDAICSARSITSGKHAARCTTGSLRRMDSMCNGKMGLKAIGKEVRGCMTTPTLFASVYVGMLTYLTSAKKT